MPRRTSEWVKSAVSKKVHAKTDGSLALDSDVNKATRCKAKAKASGCKAKAKAVGFKTKAKAKSKNVGLKAKA